MVYPIFPGLALAALAWSRSEQPRLYITGLASSKYQIRRCMTPTSSCNDPILLEEMKETANRIARRGFGILATDESIPTAGKRLHTIGVENTYENRQNFRELLYTTEGLGQYISGVIMFDETLYQRTAGGVRFIKVLHDEQILTGIKVDTGLQPLTLESGETATQGLDGLGERCKAYRQEGASFAKWRAVLKIGPGTPSPRALAENTHGLARYASICQEHGLVPIVEPELTLSPGDYGIERAAFESERVLSSVMRSLNEFGVAPEAMLLKPSMVLPGLDSPISESSKEQVAKYTVRTMMRCVPPAVPGIHFLSGGMGAEEATQNLQQLQRECPDAPWSLSFSYGRALQDAVLKEWAGKSQNVERAQRLLLELARVNSEAQCGIWNEEHPTPGGERMSLPKLSYSSERRKSTNLFNW